MSRKSRIYQFVAASSALMVGLCIYLLDRQPETVYFISRWFSANGEVNPVFGMLGNYLPTFLHVYAFILLTVVVFAQSYRQIVIICLSWLTIDSLFEIAQIDFISQSIASQTPDWFVGVPFLENTANYLMMGTFDVFDLLSIVAGTIAAYMTIIFSKGVPENVAHT